MDQALSARKPAQTLDQPHPPEGRHQKQGNYSFAGCRSESPNTGQKLSWDQLVPGHYVMRRHLLGHTGHPPQRVTSPRSETELTYYMYKNTNRNLNNLRQQRNMSLMKAQKIKSQK